MFPFIRVTLVMESLHSNRTVTETSTFVFSSTQLTQGRKSTGRVHISHIHSMNLSDCLLPVKRKNDLRIKNLLISLVIFAWALWSVMDFAEHWGNKWIPGSFRSLVVVMFSAGNTFIWNKIQSWASLPFYLCSTEAATVTWYFSWFLPISNPESLGR